MLFSFFSKISEYIPKVDFSMQIRSPGTYIARIIMLTWEIVPRSSTFLDRSCDFEIIERKKLMTTSFG